MIDKTNVSIALLSVHRVGNRLRGEGVVAAKRLHPLTKEIEGALLNYFLTPFDSPEVFQFAHPSNLKLNELYAFSKWAFSEPDEFLNSSISSLKHLYECSDHPKIKSGEFYCAYFKNVGFGKQSVDALGFFKSETKDSFIRIEENPPEMLAVNVEHGTNLKNLDKGCIILNVCPKEGYRVLIVDKNSDATRFWQEKFLNVAAVQDNHFYTDATLSMCQKFSEDILTEKVERKDQIAFLQKSVDFFSNSESFNTSEFSKAVFDDKALAAQFRSYKEQYETKAGLPKLDAFSVSKPSVKKLKRRFKNHIRLDTQIEVKLKFRDPDASSTNVERGFDQKRKMHFYKLFFNKEL